MLNVTSRCLLGPSYAVREELTGDTSHAVFSRVTNATPLSAHSDPTNINSFSTLRGGPKTPSSASVSLSWKSALALSSEVCPRNEAA